MKDVKWKGEEVSCNTDAYAHLELIEDGDDVDSVRLEMHMPGSWIEHPGSWLAQPPQMQQPSE